MQRTFPFGVKSVADPALCQAVMAAGGTCIYRAWSLGGDCPNVDGDAKTEAYRVMASLWGAGIDLKPSYLEITNECNYEVHYLPWWNTFYLEAIRLGKLWGYPPLVLPTYAPGQPTEEWHLDLLKPALLALRDFGGLFGAHDYSVDQPNLCPCNQWLSCRHRRIYAKLVEMGLGGLGIAVTETGRGWGNSPPDVADFACWWNSVRHDPGLRFGALWTAGPTNAWPLANLNGWLLPIAQALR